MRLALVHEFKTRSRVFIATEAGAKGLNLQFAGTLVNYDLPWNPQRIEQRIGRIHRYGQQTDVLVINFLARGNEAQRLTFEILSQKLDLFGTVLDASDVVLHEARSNAAETLAGALGADFEASLRRIYDRARSVDEIEAELRALREDLEDRRERFSDTHDRTAGLIESRFDDQVKKVFQRIQDELPGELAALDRDLEQVVTAYLDAAGIPWSRQTHRAVTSLQVEPHPALPDELAEGLSVALGSVERSEDLHTLHVGHPLVRAALDEAREATKARSSVEWPVPESSELRFHRGRKGRLAMVRLRHRGFETVERLLCIALFEGSGEPLPMEQGEWLLGLPARPNSDLSVDVSDEDLDDAVEFAVFEAQGELVDGEQDRFKQATKQLETWMDDQLLLQRRERSDLQLRLRSAVSKRDGAVGAEARTKAERASAGLTEKLEQVELEVARLLERDDDDYTRWNERNQDRRYRAPEVETLMDVDFVLT